MIICLDRGRGRKRERERETSFIRRKKKEWPQLLKLNKAVNYFTRVLTSFFNLAEASMAFQREQRRKALGKF